MSRSASSLVWECRECKFYVSELEVHVTLQKGEKATASRLQAIIDQKAADAMDADAEIHRQMKAIYLKCN